MALRRPPDVLLTEIPQCSVTLHGVARCRQSAESQLFGPDGTPVKGRFVCQEHGIEVLAHFQNLFSETWFLVPLVTQRAASARIP